MWLAADELLHSAKADSEPPEMTVQLLRDPRAYLHFEDGGLWSVKVVSRSPGLTLLALGSSTLDPQLKQRLRNLDEMLGVVGPG